MALPWVQVYSNINAHPKTSNLVDALGLKSSDVEPETIAVGMLVGLWTWAAVNAYDGDLSCTVPRTIAKACGWKKAPDKLIDALIKCGWLDQDMKIHDWAEYAELYINRQDYQREQARLRVQAYRERKRAELGIKSCAYCGKEATGWDHIIPTSKGGEDVDENRVPCCKRCNSSKAARDLATFLNNTTVSLNLESILANEKLMRYVYFDETGHFVTLQNV